MTILSHRIHLFHREITHHCQTQGNLLEDMALQFERLLRGPNAQTTLPASKLYDVTPNAAVKQVPPSEYPQTTTAQSKSFSDMKFGNNVSTNRDTLKCVKILLAECSLLSQPDQLSWIPRREPHTTHLPSHHPSTVLTPPIYPHTTHLLSSHHPSTLTPPIYPYTIHLPSHHLSPITAHMG
jgi:hypothetical protein